MPPKPMSAAKLTALPGNPRRTPYHYANEPAVVPPEPLPETRLRAVKLRLYRAARAFLSTCADEHVQPGGNTVYVANSANAFCAVNFSADGAMRVEMTQQGAIAAGVATRLILRVLWRWWIVGRWCGLRAWLWRIADAGVKRWQQKPSRR